MKIGHRFILREQPDGQQGGGQNPAPQTDDRYQALEKRMGDLTRAVEYVYTNQTTSAQQRQEEQRAQQEFQRAQGFVTEAQQKVAAARQRLAAAHEEGDSTRIAEATEALGNATASHTAASMHAQTVAQRQQQQAQQATQKTQQPRQPQVDDTNLRNWRDRNKEWYGVDPDMTRAAMTVAQEVEKEGILETGSQQYFQAIDARLRKQYADRMPQPSTAQMQTPRGSMSNPSSNQGQSRIPASVAEGYRRMGIDVDNPDIAKKMLQAREKAVAKGFLPDQPLSGAVLSR